MERRSEEKKFLQSELHCRADTLYLPEGHLASHQGFWLPKSLAEKPLWINMA